ncbi:hypothetical protein BAS10_06170 [Elizabethkingia meningoseptica]|uniref:hypothetical protein n=1 Tax=Elizabethkingia meningoseptica TaxID=238 RepID=UPI0009995304|nr:hypothetical protein [Elizabethkingia meningoseptica]OPB98215.1 hypothetical protein BAS10_06170 [Elizabethkingia meningoseptica]
MITIKRSIFPLGKIHVNINNEDFTLGSNETRILGSNKEGEYTVKARIKWVESSEVLVLNNNSKIKIVSSISDLHYIFWGSIVLIMCVLLYFSIISPIFLGVSLLIYLAPLAYYTYFKRSQYFKIYLE